MRQAKVRAFDMTASYGLVACWSEDVSQACFVESGRGYKAVKLHLVDAATGQVQTPLVERSKTYISLGGEVRILGFVKHLQDTKPPTEFPLELRSE